jgi:predicted HTH transcriptional regulator
MGWLSTSTPVRYARTVSEEVGLRLRVTLRPTQVRSPTPDDTDRAIVALVRAPEGLAARQVADRFGLTSRTTLSRLAALVARGLARDIGAGP